MHQMDCPHCELRKTMGSAIGRPRGFGVPAVHALAPAADQVAACHRGANSAPGATPPVNQVRGSRRSHSSPRRPAALKTGWRVMAPTPRVTIGAATAFTIALPFFSEPIALIPAERAGPTPGTNPTAFFARPPRKLKKPGSPR